MPVVDSVRDTLGRFGMAAAGDIIIVGVSGGPDSLCLLHVLATLAPELELTLHVAHLNHGLRGAESDADAAYVASTAVAWGLPVTVEQADVGALAQEPGLSLEEAARNARYGFLSRLAIRLDAASVAVGHNEDDQAETVLMHFLRGSGIAGLRGMLPKTPNLTIDGAPVPVTLIRPLLFVPRADILTYCQDHNLEPRFDRSNEDTTYFRNRLRHELLPSLAAYNPQIRRVLTTTAAVAAADYELLHQQSLAAFSDVAQPTGEGAILFDLEAWRSLPLSLKRSSLREAIHRLRGGLRNVNFVPIERAVRALLEGDAGTRITLPAGLEAVLGYSHFVVGEAGLQLPVADAPRLVAPRVRLHDEIALSTALPDWRVATRHLHPEALPAGWQSNSDPWQAWLDADTLGRDPSFRVRREGDRFQPLGMAGQTKLLAEFFTNTKIPATARDHWPLLVDNEDQIAWVCGLRVDERARVSQQTTRVLHVRFHPTEQAERVDP